MTRRPPRVACPGRWTPWGGSRKGKPPRPDPSLAPAYLALTPLRGWQSGYAGSAHHAHPQGAQGMPPERPHHRGSRREGATPPNQPRSGIGGETPQALRWLGPRPRAGTGSAAWHVKRTAQGPALRVGPRRPRHRGARRNPLGELAASRMERGGAGGARWEQVHTSWLDQERNPDARASQLNGGLAPGRELRAPDGALAAGCLQPGRRQSGQLGRWTGAEGEWDENPDTPSTTRVTHRPRSESGTAREALGWHTRGPGSGCPRAGRVGEG